MPKNETPILAPEVIGKQVEDDSAEIELRIPDKLIYFTGHFPGTPILPGVVQIHWAAHLAMESFAFDLPFHHMEAIKFKDLILPGQTLWLSLHWNALSGRLAFNFRSPTREHSSGRIYFNPDHSQTAVR